MAGLLKVNGKIFRDHRNLIGMSQLELSRRSGYSERLIRKAEAGGTLRLATIRDLAMAMTFDGHSITLQDLTLFALSHSSTDSVSRTSCDSCSSPLDLPKSSGK